MAANPGATVSYTVDASSLNDGLISMTVNLSDVNGNTDTFAGTFASVLFGAVLFSLCATLFTSAIILNGESGEDYVGAIAVFATMGAISVFASLFVVASTVALSVEQRRADMALLRSAGATPRQVRRLVLREIALVTLPAENTGPTSMLKRIT